MSAEDKVLAYQRVKPVWRRRVCLLAVAGVLVTYVFTYFILRGTHVLLRGTGREEPDERVESGSVVLDVIFWPPRKLEERHWRSVWRPDR